MADEGATLGPKALKQIAKLVREDRARTHNDGPHRQRWFNRNQTSGGAARMWFTIVECDCAAGTVGVDWTEHSSGCSDPPGYDEYNDVWRVYDNCIGLLGRYTSEQLIGACGSATYMTSRNGCVARWIVDDVGVDEGC